MTNILVLSGDTQTLRVPFAADVRGTGSAETVRVPAGGDVTVGGNTGDRVELAEPLSAYDLSARGNQLVVERPGGARAAIALNAATEVAFADGSATAEIASTANGLAVQLGGETVDASLTADQVSLDAADPSGFTSGGGEPPGISVTVSDAPVFDGMRQAIRETARNAWDAWAEHLAPASDVTFDLRVEQDDRFTTAGFSSQLQDTGRTVNGKTVSRGAFGAELRSGTDPASDTADSRIVLGSRLDSLEFDTGAERGKVDAESVFIHHMGHLLGIRTLRNNAGDRLTPFDTHVSAGTFSGEAAGSLALEEADPPRHLAPGGPRTALTAFPRDGQVVDVGQREVDILNDIGLPVAGSASTNPATTRNDLILDGTAQTLDVPFPADIVGTGAAETVRVPTTGDTAFGGNRGDRVELARDLAAYTVSAQGNQLVLGRNDGARVEIALNDAVEVALADGTATADIGAGPSGVSITLGGETVNGSFDPSAVTLDTGDVSSIAGEGSDTDDQPPADPSISFSVSFTDAPELDGFRSDIREAAKRAWESWSQHMQPEHNATIELEVGFGTKSGALATAGPSTTWDTGKDDGSADILLGEPAHELRFGQDPRPASPDATMTITSDPAELDYGDGNGKFDAESLFRHELGHTLAFTSFQNDPANATPFEAKIDNLTFTGSAAGSVDIRDDGTLSHLPDGVTGADGNQAAMTSGLSPDETTPVTETEVAILQDLGLPMTLDAFAATG